MTTVHSPTSTSSRSNSNSNSSSIVRRKFASPKVTLLLLFLFFVVSHWEPEGSPSIALPHGSSSSTQTSKFPSSNFRLVYVGKYGLGHRLGKMAGAFHVAQQLQSKLLDKKNPAWFLTMEVQWGVCQDGDGDQGGKIFDYLFGTNEIPVARMLMLDKTKSIVKENANANAKKPTKTKEVWIRNDCHGYYTGQSYKNTRQPIPKHYVMDSDNRHNDSSSPWFQKMDSDARLFHWLQKKYLQRHPEPMEFMKQHKFDQHTVLGLHLRLGNGETQHFVSAQRAVSPQQQDQFVNNIMALLETFLFNTGSTILSKPPLLFLATDTPTVVLPLVEKAVQAWNNTSLLVPVVTFPQPQLPQSAGVTYSVLKVGQPCFQAWKAMMADVVLLSHADVVVAGTRSSFTQIMPLSMIFSSKTPARPVKNAIQLQNALITTPRFCEIEAQTGSTMTCVQNRQAWMVRNATNQWTLSLPSSSTPQPQPVVHKMVVHFPDVDGDVEGRMEEAMTFFLTRDNGSPNLKKNETLKMVWGNKLVDTKYRQQLKKGAPLVTDWTLVDG